MYHAAVDQLIIFTINENALIGYLGWTVLGPQLLGSLVKVILTQFGPGTSLHRIQVTVFQSLG